MTTDYYENFNFSIRELDVSMILRF